ncbi:MAG: RagB/SusD family nutrient uptake outer membrane protein [Chitinophagaceae bacterium]|nr:RagB/SusD family nutrient uptake outer membrane protein [Chitinophagaceae bacterium]
MQTKILKVLFFFLVISLSSCKKWLDITPKGKILLTSAQDYSLLFDAITYYDNTDIKYLDDEGWRNASNISSVWNAWNLTAANMLYLSNSDYDRSLNATGNGGTATTYYQSMYENISTMANTIIAAKDDMLGTEAEINTVVAEAKMLRAYCYFQLINVYAKPYDAATAATDGGVPLKLDPSIESIPEPAKNTVAEVYAQIEKDINEAIPDLNITAKTPYHFNKAAGYALKAKVHLFKKEYDECIAAALESYNLNHQTFNLVSLVNATTHKPTMPLLATGVENLFFATSSESTYICQEMITLYQSSLLAYGQTSSTKDVRTDLYKRPSSSVKDYMFMLGWVPTSKEYSRNLAGLKTTEVMLMLAECYARKGQNDKVKEYLQPYLESRYKNYVHANFVLPSDITSTVQFVIGERRKELVGGFNRFFDLKRLNTEVQYQKVPTRLFPADPIATPTIPQQTYTLPVNSPLYILPFPSKVLENDKRLTSNTW